jgi:hypothetical protein
MHPMQGSPFFVPLFMALFIQFLALFLDQGLVEIVEIFFFLGISLLLKIFLNHKFSSLFKDLL